MALLFNVGAPLLRGSPSPWPDVEARKWKKSFGGGVRRSSQDSRTASRYLSYAQLCPSRHSTMPRIDSKSGSSYCWWCVKAIKWIPVILILSIVFWSYYVYVVPLCYCEFSSLSVTSASLALVYFLLIGFLLCKHLGHALEILYCSIML